jgi:hypothetical protein
LIHESTYGLLQSQKHCTLGEKAVPKLFPKNAFVMSLGSLSHVQYVPLSRLNINRLKKNKIKPRVGSKAQYQRTFRCCGSLWSKSKPLGEPEKMQVTTSTVLLCQCTASHELRVALEKLDVGDTEEEHWNWWTRFVEKAQESVRGLPWFL